MQVSQVSFRLNQKTQTENYNETAIHGSSSRHYFHGNSLPKFTTWQPQPTIQDKRFFTTPSQQSLFYQSQNDKTMKQVFRVNFLDISFIVIHNPIHKKATNQNLIFLTAFLLSNLSGPSYNESSQPFKKEKKLQVIGYNFSSEMSSICITWSSNCSMLGYEQMRWPLESSHGRTRVNGPCANAPSRATAPIQCS